MPAYEANENCQPRSDINNGLINNVTAAVIRINRQASNFLPTYHAVSVRIAIIPARKIDGVHPTNAIKIKTKTIANIRPTRLEILPNIFRTKLTIIERCAPEATTICVKPAILKESLKLSDKPPFSPSK